MMPQMWCLCRVALVIGDAVKTVFGKAQNLPGRML